MLSLITPPAVEPIDLAAAKLHLKVDFDDDDTLISALITAARLKCESYLNRSFISSVWLQTLDGFPGQFSRFSPAFATYAQGSYGYGMGSLYGYIPERLLTGMAMPIIIQKARLQSVASITYLDSGTQQRTTLDPSLYSVETGDGGRISPAFNTLWPTGLVYPGSVQITATLGYGPNASDVPSTLIAAMLLFIGHLYKNRASVLAGGGASAIELPQGAKWLLASEDWGCRL